MVARLFYINELKLLLGGANRPQQNGFGSFVACAALKAMFAKDLSKRSSNQEAAVRCAAMCLFVFFSNFAPGLARIHWRGDL